MNWLLLIFSVVKPFFSSSSDNKMGNPIAEFKEMIKENAMKVVGLFAAASALATIFAAGIIIIAVDIGSQYDRNANVQFSSMILMGIILSLLALAVSFGAAKAISNEEIKEKEKKRETLKSIGTSHPLQDSIALLIHDFVKEREAKRAQEEELIAIRRQRSTPSQHDGISKYYSSEKAH